MLTPDQEARAFGITSKFYAAKEVKLTVDAGPFFTKRAGKVLNPLPHGSLVEPLEARARTLRRIFSRYVYGGATGTWKCAGLPTGQGHPNAKVPYDCAAHRWGR